MRSRDVMLTAVSACACQEGWSFAYVTCVLCKARTHEHTESKPATRRQSTSCFAIDSDANACVRPTLSLRENRLSS